jgi:UDPglucose 6-dehydrogenase
LQVYDPIAQENAKIYFRDIKNISYVKDAYDAAKNSDLIIMMTEWNEFKKLNLVKIKEIMKTANIIDARNVYPPEELKSIGFTYVGVGR